MLVGMCLPESKDSICRPSCPLHGGRSHTVCNEPTGQGEMINESGTMSGGGGKPRGGRMCLGKLAASLVDTGTAKVELEAAEADLAACSEVLVTPWRALLRCLPLALCHNFQHTHPR